MQGFDRLRRIEFRRIELVEIIEINPADARCKMQLNPES